MRGARCLFIPIPYGGASCSRGEQWQYRPDRQDVAVKSEEIGDGK